MKLLLALVLLLCVPGLSACRTDSGATRSVADRSTPVVLCGKCGEVKGSDACCAADAEVCGCGLHHGSPGCCKMEKGADATLCSHCGEVLGSEKCCVAGAEVCPDCGMHAGSPGCCLGE